jgi:hypothetical protein
LKEIGCSKYCKPNTHAIDILFGASVSGYDNYSEFQTMVSMGSINNEAPAVVDRLLWLIEPGKYVEEDDKITRQKAVFIKDICPILD